MLRLVAEADVLVENFRPGVAARMGLDHDTLSARFPRLVYASISGYGQTGPWVHRRAYAPVVGAESGFTMAQGDARGGNPRAGQPVGQAADGDRAEQEEDPAGAGDPAAARFRGLHPLRELRREQRIERRRVGAAVDQQPPLHRKS